jgi:hypothetical protein
MSNKTSAEDHFITEDFVRDVLSGVHRLAEDEGVMEESGTEDLEYVLGGGMAVQSYVMEGYSDKVQQGELDPGEVSVDDVLRGTEDIDLGFYSEAVDTDTEIFMNRLTDASKDGFSGTFQKRAKGSYTGKIKQGEGDRADSIIINAAAELKGASEQSYREMFENRDLYSRGDTEFFRLGVEDLIASKLDGFVNNQGRQKDAEDAQNLLYFQEDNIDHDYLQNRIDQYESGEQMQQVLTDLKSERGIHTYE